MIRLFRAVLIFTAGFAVVGCSTPYGALMTPELLSRVEGGEQIASPTVAQICPDRGAGASEAYSGSHRLTSGDSKNVVALAGGRADLEACMGLEGFTSIKPDMAVSVIDGGQDLTIEVVSTADTVLLIQKPNGSTAFDDDDGEGSNGKITVNDAATGTYLIWVGTFSADAAFKPRVTISASLD